MTPATNRNSTSVGQTVSPRTIRYLIGLGWLLLTYFAFRVALLGRIGADVRAFQAAFCAGFFGYLILLWVVTRHSDANHVGAWRWWLIGCLALRGLLLATEPNDDAYRYVWEGRVQRAGFNPFLYSPDDPQLVELRDADWPKINHPDYPAVYPPVAQLEFLAAAAVYPSIYTVKLFHVLWDALIVVTLAACLRRAGRQPHLAITYALCPLILASFGIEGHVDSLMLLFVALTVWTVMTQRPNLAGAMLGLAMATKIVPVVLLPWFFVRQRRAGLIAIALFVACYLPYVIAGPAVFSSLLRFVADNEFFSMLGAFRVTSFDTHTSRAIVASVLGVILLALAWRRRDFAQYAAAATGSLLILMPVVHYWYLSWVLLFNGFGTRVRWIVAAFAMVVYFESVLQRETEGTWTMPPWAPLVVWVSFAAAWLVELTVASWAWRRTRGPTNPGTSASNRQSAIINLQSTSPRR